MQCHNVELLLRYDDRTRSAEFIAVNIDAKTGVRHVLQINPIDGSMMWLSAPRIPIDLVPSTMKFTAIASMQVQPYDKMSTMPALDLDLAHITDSKYNIVLSREDIMLIRDGLMSLTLGARGDPKKLAHLTKILDITANIIGLHHED